ncbi:MAG: aminoacyl-histidine dipeptidase [Lachnospiraceae bacterium]|nr:aminoacyl-histidine dipeptidase [Lachnospiraceae bacterium]
MRVLEGLKPEKVFYYFEEISRIPHGSGNVERISDYLVDFAHKRDLRVIQDEWKNVIIFQEASPGYKEEPVLILQGHMDMVAVKTPECTKNLQTEGLQIGIDGDDIYAEGTSLGGDDGIAVAYGLAILDSPWLKHPALEMIFTVDEEVGMDGARAIDLSVLKGNRLLNLDSEDEGIFLTGCAGGARVKCELDGETSQVTTGYRKGTVVIDGLLGGHSGEEINKGRGNSNLLFGRLLWKLCQLIPVRLVSAEGGLADNAIPRKTEAVLLVREEDAGAAERILEEFGSEIAGEWEKKDPGICLKYSWQSSAQKADEASTGSCVAWTEAATRKAAAMLAGLPDGVQAMSADIEGMVETSLNLGILRADGKKLVAESSVRSSMESAKAALIAKLEAIVALAGGRIRISGEYPGWKYRADSPLREKMIRVYRELYGAEPRIEVIHAGLECGLLGSKIPDLDCVSIGPNMKNIHTTEETMSISSVKRVWDYLVKLLEQKETA